MNPISRLTRRSFVGVAAAALAALSAAALPTAARAQNAPPVTGNPVVTIETPKGKIKIKLFPEEAPKTVANFVKLAKEGFYDGTTFHRVEPDFVIQGGDPNTKTGKGQPGTGGPGYDIPNEANKKLKHNVGAVAMANAGRDTAGSQFYIVIGKPAYFLDEKYPDGVNKYTLFGQVIDGQKVAEKIGVGDKMTKVSVADPGKGAASKKGKK